ncbi:HD domain-containing protein [Candidatus Dojkabacteria bacterium]|nr:HD domain-containing protein [Candidatus Dojkabacteria bacterium]
MKIAEIYKKYKIPPQLQEHQLRVAAVAKQIVDNFKAPSGLDETIIITSCLLHDMGNIIKFNLQLYPEHLKPEGYEYWKGVQDEFILKYGEDEHKATFQIAKEIGVGEDVMEILRDWGFANGNKTAESENFNAKISRYSDQRVDIDGIKSMEERHHKSRDRYKKRNHFKHLTEVDKFDELVGYWQKIENQIFEKCEIKPEEINDESVQALLDNLRLSVISI